MDYYDIVFIFILCLILFFTTSFSDQKCYEYEFEYKDKIMKADSCYYKRVKGYCRVNDMIYYPEKIKEKEVKCKEK